MTLQQQTKEYLENNGIKKKYFATYLGVYPSQISNWFSGTFNLSSLQEERVRTFLKGDRLSFGGK